MNAISPAVDTPATLHARRALALALAASRSLSDAIHSCEFS